MTKHIEELDDVINKHEQLLKKLTEVVSNLSVKNTNAQQPPPIHSRPEINNRNIQQREAKNGKKSESINKKQIHNSLYPPVKQQKETKVSIAKPPPKKYVVEDDTDEDEDDVEEDTDELDAEIEEELRELDDEEDIEEIDLSSQKRNNQGNVVVIRRLSLNEDI